MEAVCWRLSSPVGDPISGSTSKEDRSQHNTFAKMQSLLTKHLPCSRPALGLQQPTTRVLAIAPRANLKDDIATRIATAWHRRTPERAQQHEEEPPTPSTSSFLLRRVGLGVGRSLQAWQHGNTFAVWSRAEACIEALLPCRAASPCKPWPVEKCWRYVEQTQISALNHFLEFDSCRHVSSRANT